MTEAEIDAMYLTEHGYLSVALGGSQMSAYQAKELRRLKPCEVVIFTDNDAAGEKAARSITAHLLGQVKLTRIVFPTSSIKDANDFEPAQLRSIVTDPITFQFNF